MGERLWQERPHCAGWWWMWCRGQDRPVVRRVDADGLYVDGDGCRCWPQDYQLWCRIPEPAADPWKTVEVRDE